MLSVSFRFLYKKWISVDINSRCFTSVRHAWKCICYLFKLWICKDSYSLQSGWLAKTFLQTSLLMANLYISGYLLVLAGFFHNCFRRNTASWFLTYAADLVLPPVEHTGEVSCGIRLGVGMLSPVGMVWRYLERKLYLKPRYYSAQPFSFLVSGSEAWEASEQKMSFSYREIDDWDLGIESVQIWDYLAYVPLLYTVWCHKLVEYHTALRCRRFLTDAAVLNRSVFIFRYLECLVRRIAWSEK